MIVVYLSKILQELIKCDRLNSKKYFYKLVDK